MFIFNNQIKLIWYAFPTCGKTPKYPSLQTWRLLRRQQEERTQRTQNVLLHLFRYFKNILSNSEMFEQRKEVIKKIIHYTTQGVDTSRFYPEMVIASATKDIV